MKCWMILIIYFIFTILTVYIFYLFTLLIYNKIKIQKIIISTTQKGKKLSINKIKKLITSLNK